MEIRIIHYYSVIYFQFERLCTVLMQDCRQTLFSSLLCGLQTDTRQIVDNLRWFCKIWYLLTNQSKGEYLEAHVKEFLSSLCTAA